MAVSDKQSWILSVPSMGIAVDRDPPECIKTAKRTSEEALHIFILCYAMFLNCKTWGIQ